MVAQHPAVERTILSRGAGRGPAIDAFARARVSNPTGLFESASVYDKQPLLWNETLTGTATSVHQTDKSEVKMTVSAANDTAIRQTVEYFRYQPGKSHLVLATFAAGAGDANVRKRTGYFDDEDGIFLEEINGAVWVVKRSNISGTPVDTRIAQADWSLDNFPELDISKAQILIIDMEWLGVGRVRVGFVIDGVPVYVHEFLHANSVDGVYMTSAQLPCRYEIEATGTPSGASSLSTICSAVISEGGQEDLLGLPFAYTQTAAESIAASRVPVLSLRPKTTFGAVGVRNRGLILPQDFSVTNTGTGTAVVEIIYDGTLTNASFASVSDNSVAEVDVSATAVADGEVVATFFVPASVQAKAVSAASIIGKLPLGLNIAGDTPRNITIAVSNIGTVTAASSMNWQEYR